MHGADLGEQLGLVGVVEIPSLPAVQPARGPVGQGDIDQRADENVELLPRILVSSAVNAVNAVSAVDELTAQAEYRAAEQLVLAGIVPIQRGRRDVDARRDGLHADTVIAQLAKRFRRRARDLRFPVLGPAADLRAGVARHGHHDIVKP